MEYYLLWNDKTLGINSLSVHYFHQSRVFDRFAELQQNSNSSSSVYTCNYILTVGHDGFTNIGHARGHSKMTGYRYIIYYRNCSCLSEVHVHATNKTGYYLSTCIVHPVILQWSISNFHFFPQSFTSQNIFNTQNYIPYCLLLEFSDTYYNIKIMFEISIFMNYKSLHP